jgi:hypothetical protein
MISLMRNLKRCLLILAFCSASFSSGWGANAVKTLRVEHGRPVVVVTDKQVLLLEFAAESREAAVVKHDGPELRHCRAKYHSELFDGATGTITDGQGMVEEIYRIASVTADGQQVEDAGSHTQITAGEFTVSWSEATAGARSWLYYRTDSPIRFIQQPKGITFDAVDRAQFERYFRSRNVTEFASAGRTVKIIGPAVFSGDMPLEDPIGARVDSCRIRDNAVELSLVDLAINRSYVVESSYELKPGNWNVVHTFPAHETTRTWSDPLSKDVGVVFYRIREGH